MTTRNNSPVLHKFQKSNPHASGFNGEAADQAAIEFFKRLPEIQKEVAELWRAYLPFAGYRHLAWAFYQRLKGDPAYTNPKKARQARREEAAE